MDDRSGVITERLVRRLSHAADIVLGNGGPTSTATMGMPRRVAPSGIKVAWGKATDDWDPSTSTANIITLTPCKSQTGEAMGESDVSIMIVCPDGAIPGWVPVKKGDILAYIAFSFTVATLGNFNGLLMPSQYLPQGGAQYTVLQRDTTNGKPIWDFVRCP